MKKSKLVIIGAGAAGIAAATKLVTNGFENFVLLEAENRIGGRVHTVPFENKSIDFGAQWVHGQKDNPVYEMAKEFDLVENECPDFFNSLSFNSSHSPIDRESSLQLFKLVHEIMDDDEAMARHEGSLGEYVRDRLKKDLTNHSQLSHLLSPPLFDQVIEFFGKWENTIDGSDSWFETSAKGSLQYVKLEGCMTTTWKTGGYSNALKLMMKQMPGQTPIDLSKQLILNKQVDKINWEDPHHVIVTCKDGMEYFTEKVLSTVSLGVLKSKSELFAPPLPSWKTNAIQGLFIGTVDKIFVKFPHKWWPDNNLGFNLFWTKADEKTLFRDIGGVNDKPWVMDVIGFYLTTQDPLTYLGWITGPSARYMESLSDEQVSIDTMKLLRHFLGTNYTIPDPVRVLKSSWGTNPHFRGSYSCRSLTTEKLNTSATELGAPVENTQGKPVILFAGEATHPRFYSTVHGAIETGWREADRVLNSDQQPQNGTRLSDCIVKDVVIVGAGMAGIGAGLKLLENSVANFVILEAQSQPGGRIKSVDMGNGVFLEEGAQWIHGQCNPVYRVADQHQLTSHIRSDEAQGRYLKDDGTEIPLTLVHQVSGAIGDMLEECELFYESKDKAYPISIGHYLDEMFDNYIKIQPPDQDIDSMKQLFDWHRRFQIIDNSCSSLYNLSAKAWGQYQFCGGDDYINLNQGFSSVVNAMCTQIPQESIKLSCPVKQIVWKDLYKCNDEAVYKPNENDTHKLKNMSNESDKLANMPKESNVTSDKMVNMPKENNISRDKVVNVSNGEDVQKDGNITDDIIQCDEEKFLNENFDKINLDTNAELSNSVAFKNDIKENHSSHTEIIHNQGNSMENTEENQKENKLDEIIVKCEDGTIYRTKYVIVTSSLGYLKQNQKNMFVPRLPSPWSQVISSMGFASITKIFLIYDQPWWTKQDKGFQFIWTRPSSDSAPQSQNHFGPQFQPDDPQNESKSGPQFQPWLREVTGFDVLSNIPCVLLGWVGGACAEEVERVSEMEIGVQCTQLLTHFLGQDVPLPSRVVRSVWSNNNYIQGAYSHTTTTCDQLGLHARDMTHPVITTQGRSGVYFAGEALHEKYFSTTHGAFLSGEEQAEKIVKQLRSSS